MARRNGATEAMPAVHNPSTMSTNSAVSAVLPGGSMNQISNVDMVELVKILNSKHITYFDWNVNSGDTADNCSADDIVNNVTSGIAKYDNSVVLLHDDSNRSTTAEAIEPLVESIKAQGAEILPIDNNTYKVQYIKSDTVG